MLVFNNTGKLKSYVFTFNNKVVFNNTGRLKSYVFTFNNKVLENDRNYTYLCVNFSLSDSFTDVK